MFREMLKSKIHRATITEANRDYRGSLTIDKNLLEAANLVPNEKIQVINLNTGARFETYAIEGLRGSGEVCANGGAAELAKAGEKVIIISYCLVDDQEVRTHAPRVLFVDEQNRVLEEVSTEVRSEVL